MKLKDQYKTDCVYKKSKYFRSIAPVTRARAAQMNTGLVSSLDSNQTAVTLRQERLSYNCSRVETHKSQLAEHRAY